MTRRVCIVQARMGSARLPGKVLLPLAGSPLLGHQLRRLRVCSAIDEIVVATTDRAEDAELAEYVQGAGHRVFRGSSDDVLARVVGAAAYSAADVVVRITGDCPLIDPWVTALVIDSLTTAAPRVDYASNVLRRTYPRGLDVEAFHRDTLAQMDAMATKPADREHVTTVLRATHAERFRTLSIEDEVDNSEMRWTVDESADLAFMEVLFERLDLAANLRPYQEIVHELRQNPELLAINDGVKTWTPDPTHVETGVQR